MNLKDLRKSKGLTQEEAAEIVGLSRRGYQNLETGSYKKKDSKTLRFALAQLETIPNPKKRKQGISLTHLSREIEGLLEGEDVSFVYFIKSGNTYSFVLESPMDDLTLYGLEEELSLILSTEVSFERFEELIKDKERASGFFAKARRIYPMQ